MIIECQICRSSCPVLMSSRSVDPLFSPSVHISISLYLEVCLRIFFKTLLADNVQLLDKSEIYRISKEKYFYGETGCFTPILG